MKHSLFLSMVLTISVLANGQPHPSQVCFLNKGDMYIAPIVSNTSATTLYLSQSMQVTGEANIYQQGITCIGGSFYQDATTHVFYQENGLFLSSGRFVFSKDYNERHQITTLNNPIKDFSRKDHFVAFPEIEIETTDELHVPAKMGIDAIRIITNSRSGKMRLESTEYGIGLNAKIYNASLRLTGAGTSEQLVAPDAVVVEQDLLPYRVEEGAAGTGPIFAFASPYKNLRSGYFAGNWIRKMIEGQDGHVRYVYGNTPDNGTISRDQYIISPDEQFIAGKGYLIKLRKMDFAYEDLIHSGGLVITGDIYDNYNKSKFVFDCNVYNMAEQEEQLFADEILFTRSISKTTIPRDTTINWIIGNSYTAPISIAKLKEIMGNSPLYFEPNVYVFPAGSTSYQVYQMQPNASSMQVIDIEEIPSMSYFMVRLDKTKKQEGTFTLRKQDLLTHGSGSHSLRSASPSYQNEVVFRLSPESNYNIYDLAGIGLRPNANKNSDKYDLLKTGNDKNELFQIYTLADDGKMLSTNILPETTERVSIYLSPGMSEGMFRLEASRMESLTTEGLWLEDLKSGKIIDLKKSGGSYVFEVNTNDEYKRFIAHFKANIPTQLNQIESESPLQVYYANNQVVLKGLLSEDLHAQLQIFDMRGYLLYNQPVLNIPETRMNISIVDGIYIIRLKGSRTATLRFKK